MSEELSDQQRLESLGLSADQIQLLLESALPVLVAEDWLHEFPQDSAESLLAFYNLDGFQGVDWRRDLFSLEEASQWTELDLVISPKQASQFEADGLNPRQVKFWCQYSNDLQPEEICSEWARVRSLDSQISPEMALAWSLAAPPAQLEGWLNSGASPVEVAEMTAETNQVEIQPDQFIIWNSRFPDDSLQTTISFLSIKEIEIEDAIAWRSAQADAQTTQQWSEFFGPSTGLLWFKADFELDQAKAIDELLEAEGSGGSFGIGEVQKVSRAAGWKALYPDLNPHQITLIGEWLRLGFSHAEHVEEWAKAGVSARQANDFAGEGCRVPAVAGHSFY